ncbi:MAG: maleylpyruvate isomerase family mycothiol-dependent enzyme [Streptosporangiaceae bacterium]
MNDAADTDRVLADLSAATDQLLHDAGGLSDRAAREPSLLPGWTRGHVLTHLARNAEGGTRLLTWARTGIPGYEYESLEARAAAIEAGSGRPAPILVADVQRTAAVFAEAAADMPAAAWQRLVRYTGGQEPRAEVIVPSRLAEVLIHHVDLDIGFGPRDWPAPFVADMLQLVADGLGRRDGMAALRLTGTDTGRDLTIGNAAPAGITVSGPEPELLAWLLGRSGGRALGREPDGPLPNVLAI